MRIFITFIALTLVTESCTSRQDTAREIVTQWVDKEIILPYDRFTIGGESVDIDRDLYTYKIVNYIDSAGCTRCRMKLDLWNMFMSRLDADDADVTLLSVIHSDNSDDLRFAIESSGFNYPVAIDPTDEFGNTNNPPDDQLLHTFLLDDNDHIIAIGNPVLNPHIGRLYRSIILGDNIAREPADMPITADMPSRNIGITHPGDTVSVPFYLTNKSDKTVVIDTLVSSCDCTTGNSKHSYIAPSCIETLNVRIVSDSITGPFQRQIQIYYQGYPAPTTIQVTGFNI